MRKRDLQNEKLDRIGRRLLETARVSGEEIERIVASPRLFDSVVAGIEAQKQSRENSKRSENWLNISFINRRTAAGALAILLVSAMSAAVFVFKKQESFSQESVKSSEQTIKPEARQQIVQTENPPEFSVIKRTAIAAVKNRVTVEPIITNVKKPKTPNRAPKSNRIKPSRKSYRQTPEVFYSLSIAGNWEASGEELHVVRAEISRSELFALGVNLPVENEAAKIKTDLLVGADGVARAIRFIE